MNTMRGNKSYIIAGPTASGKSDFALMLAHRLGGTIINCDSVQIYAGIESISASPFAKSACRPPKEGLSDHLQNGRTNGGKINGVPHRLFSILPLTRQINIAEYLEMARAEYEAADGPVIFVGGTGYYINALLNGISPMPEISAESRGRARAMLRERPEDARKLLPENEWRDPQRTARALEVFLETGRHIGEWQSLPRTGKIRPTPYKILINPPREVLAQRIAARLQKMLADGALDEARAVMTADWDENRAIGASELCKFLRCEITAAQRDANWLTRTNQYAKRQRTWLRTQYAADLEIPNIPTDKDLEIVFAK